MSDSIAVQFATLEALAEELTVLGAELSAEAQLCRSAGWSLVTAVDGELGATGGGVASGWAGLVDLLAQGTGSVAGTLRAAADSYRRLEAELSDRNLYEQAGVAVP